MKSNDRPSAFGVFKPVGHVIVAFPTDGDTQGALAAVAASSKKQGTTYESEARKMSLALAAKLLAKL